MTVLSRLTALGGARETGGQGTYLAPTFSIPWTAAEYEDATDPLRDESVRANDSVVQAVVAGPKQANWSITCSNYLDILGNWFVAMGLFDTVTPGVSTTFATGGSLAGATSISSTATIPSGSVVKVGSGSAVEYATTGSPSGGGPYSIPVTGLGAGGGLIYAHSSGDPIVSQTTHTFKQNRTFSTVWPSFSFTTQDGVDTLGWSGCVASELGLKIDPKALTSSDIKFTGQPSATQSTFSYAASAMQPTAGWGWTVTNASGVSTRGLTGDFTLKRSDEAIHASTGSQAPREVFAGALECDLAYKAIFENDTDINLFRSYIQTPTVHTVTKPLASGGESLVLTMSVSAYTTSKVVNSGSYLTLDQAVVGVNNSTDSGVTSVKLLNFVSASY